MLILVLSMCLAMLSQSVYAVGETDAVNSGGAGLRSSLPEKPTAVFSGTTTVELGTCVSGQFTFSLVPDAAVCEDVTYLDAEGTEHAFSALAFPTEVGTYQFTLRENDPPEGSSYDKDNKTVPIVVSVTQDDTTGEYAAAVTYSGGTVAPEFVNTFKCRSLAVSKTVAEGGSWIDDFEFTLTFDAGISGLSGSDLRVKGITLGAGNTATVTKVNDANASTIIGTDEISSITYNVKSGQQLTLEGVPVGLGYTIHETTTSP